MKEIARVKKEIELRQWAEMVKCRNESGMTVTEWCKENGINLKTYYYRLKRVRQAVCEEIEHHDIVPVEPVCEYHEDRCIRLMVDNVIVDVPDNFNAETLKRLLGVLK